MNIKKMVKISLVLGMVFLYGSAMAMKGEKGKGRNVSRYQQALSEIKKAQGNLDTVKVKDLKAVRESQDINPDSLECKKRVWKVAQGVFAVASIPVGIASGYIGLMSYVRSIASGYNDVAGPISRGIFLVPTGSMIAGVVYAGNKAHDYERQLQEHAQMVRDSKKLIKKLDAYNTKVQVLLGLTPEGFTREEKLALWSLFKKNKKIKEKFNEYAVSYPVDFDSVKTHILGDTSL